MSKLGLHVHSWNKSIFDYCVNVGAAVIKSLDHNPMYVNEVKKAQPKAILLARYYVGNQLLDDPIRRADEFTDQLLRAIGGCNYDAAEGYNEWDGDLQYHQGSDAGLEVWKRYADFEARRSQRLHVEGLKSAVGGCSVGTPPEHWFSAFRPALEEGDFLHLHEYSAPRMWDQVQWHSLKYRAVYKYLKEHDLPQLGLIISECGIDGGVSGRPKEGWRKFGLTPQQYMEDWKWIDGEWRKDWYVVGGCAYDCGSTAGMGWLSFNIDPEMLPLWARYAGEQGVTYWETKEEEMPSDVWKNVPPAIAQWRPVIEKVTSSFHVPIPPVNGIHVSPAKVMAVIIKRESEGKRMATNPESGAAGLCQIMPFHFESGQDPYDPEWNVRKGLSILQDKLYPKNASARELQKALFYYSGKADRPWEPFIELYWAPFVKWYKEFWGIDLEPSEANELREEIARLKKGRENDRAAMVAARNTLDAALGR